MKVLKLEINNRAVQLVFYGIILFWVIWDRIAILEKFGFVFNDGDQTIMWAALKDYSMGLFMEPRFYGQNYNTFLEVIFAMPLYYLSFPPYIALPVATSFLALFPYVLLSFLTLLKKNNLVLSLIVLALPLFLPIEYGIITTLPRGFVTGVAIASLGLIGSFYPANKWWGFLIAFLTILAYSVNSNSIIIGAPFLLAVLLDNKNNKQIVVFLIGGLFFGGAIHLIVQYFYASHPFYNLHPLGLEYSLKAFIKSFEHMDYFLNFNTPFLWSSGSWVLLVFLIMALVFWKQGDKGKCLAFVCVPFLILVTMGFEKVHQGTHSLFFHYSRMFLAIPVFLSFGLAFIKIKNYALLSFGLLFLSYHYFDTHHSELARSIEKAQNYDRKCPVTVATNQRISDDCKQLNRLCQMHGVELIVISNHFFQEQFNYGCNCLESYFPKTIRPAYERRTWRMLEIDTITYKRVLLVDLTRNFNDEFQFITKLENGAFLIRNNNLKTFELLDTLKIPYRSFK